MSAARPLGRGAHTTTAPVTVSRTDIAPAAPAAGPPVEAAPTATPDPIARAAPTTRVRKGRFEFLDALRGIAAMAVVLQHAAEFIWPAYLKFSIEVVRPGEFGVVLFFLVSGFIIPASIEKYASLGRFWVGRFFRLFPLYWACVLAALFLHYVIDRYPMPEGWANRPRLYAGVNMSMVQGFVEGPLVIGASWSLAYEMVFYLVVSLLFLAGLTRRSVPLAVGGLCAVLVAGTYIPARLVTAPDAMHRSWLTVVGVTLLVAIFFACRAATPFHRLVAVGIAGLAVPLALNQGERMWFSLLLFSMMFTGTVMYRITTGEVSAQFGWSVVAFAAAVALLVHFIHVESRIEPLAGARVSWQTESLTFLLALGAFVVAMALRQREFPRVLLFLGRISYSLYLVHTLVLYAVPWWSEEAAASLGISNKILTYATWVGLTVAVPWVTFRLIEKPFQDLGHRLTKRAVAPVPTPAA